MYHDVFLLIAIGLYVLASISLYLSIHHQSRNWRLISIISCFAGAVVHALAQSEHWINRDVPDASLMTVLSLCSLATVFLLCSSVFSRDSLYDASLVALPLTVTILALEWLLPAQNLLLNDLTGTALHILGSVTALEC
jgi:ABC-type uncharacterized transport system permease subunit